MDAAVADLEAQEETFALDKFLQQNICLPSMMVNTHTQENDRGPDSLEGRQGLASISRHR